MIVLGVLVLAVLGVVVALVSRRAAPTAGHPVDGADHAVAGIDHAGLHRQLGTWVDAGLLDGEQAAAIEAHESRVAEQPTRPSAAGAQRTHTSAAVVEALGYLGGVLAITGVVLLVAHAWQDLSLGGRLALSGLTAAALIGAGAAVPEARGSTMRRLRAFLWTLGTAAVGVFAAVAGREVLGTSGDEGGLIAWTAAAIAATSGALWWGRQRPVQQLVTLVAGTVAAGAAAMVWFGEVPSGVTIWVIGAGMVALGVRRVGTQPVLDALVGSVAMGVGSLITVADDPGIRLLFVVATGAVLVGLVLERRWVRDTATIVVLAVVGSITVLQSLPALVGTMAQDAAVATGAVLWLASALVLLVGVSRRTRVPVVLEVLGAVGLLVGAAVMAVQEPGVATVVGLLTAAGLLGVSLVPGRVALSPVGAAGLLVYVPWTIAWYFPGQGRVPLLISVSGVVIIGVAVMMARSGGRFRRELGHQGG